MKIINGWSPEERRKLCERTGASIELVERFCEAVDKPLYLSLPTHIKRATLHFHLANKHMAANPLPAAATLSTSTTLSTNSQPQSTTPVTTKTPATATKSRAKKSLATETTSNIEKSDNVVAIKDFRKRK